MHTPVNKLIEAKNHLKQHFPQLGSALDMVNLYSTERETWHTNSLTTDGKTIWYNTEYVGRHDKLELVFLLGYMAYVIRDRLYEATGELQGLARWRLNLAQAYLVHAKLNHMGVGKMPHSAVVHHGIKHHMRIEDALRVVPEDEDSLNQIVDLSAMRDRPL